MRDDALYGILTGMKRDRLRIPVPAERAVQWSCVQNARFFRRMSGSDLQEWKRSARTAHTPAKEPLSAPDFGLRSAGWVGAVEKGRIRIEIAPPEHERQDAPRFSSNAENEENGEKDDPEAVNQRIQIAEEGDLVACLRFDRRKPDDSAEALSETVVSFVPLRDFQLFIRWRSRWGMPPPAPLRRAETMPLHLLCGRSRNARAAAAALELRRRGTVYDGSAPIIERPFGARQLARWIGADVEWTRRWLAQAEAERVLETCWKTCGRRRRLLNLWRLAQWAERPSLERIFRMPPNPYRLDPLPFLQEPEPLPPELGAERR